MILTNPNQLTNPDNIGAVLIYPSKETTNELIQSAIKNNLIVNCIIDDDSENSFIGKSLSEQDYPSGCYIVINYQNKKDVSDITGTFSNNLQLGYRAAVIINKNDYKPNELTSISQYGIVVIDRNDIKNSVMSVPELLTVRSVSMLRDYTNVNYSNMGSHSYVGVGKDTSGLGGGRSIGYSTNGKDFNAVITPKGLVFRQIDAYRMWRLLKPKQAEEIDAFFDNRVAKEIEKQNEGLKSAVSSANDAVNRANQAVTNSKVNSDAIVVMQSAASEAVAGANEALSNAQTAINNVASLGDKVTSAQSANDSRTKAMQADLDKAKQSISDTSKRLANVSANLDTYAKSAAEQGHDITELKKQQGKIEADLASANGNVTQLQATVSGIQGNLKDTNDNVDALSATASQAGVALQNAQSQVAQVIARADKFQTTIAEQDKKIVDIKATADGASVAASNANSTATEAKLTASAASVTASDAKSEVLTVTATASDAKLLATNANSQAMRANATASSVSVNLSGVEKTANQAKTTADSNAKQISNVANTVTSVNASIKATQKELSGKVNQTTVDTLSNTVKQQQAQQQIFADQIKTKLTSSDVTGILKNGKYATQDYTQNLINATSKTLSANISEVKQTADSNHQADVNRMTNLQASIDGLQSTVRNNSDSVQNQITQLANVTKSEIKTAIDNNTPAKSIGGAVDLDKMMENGKYLLTGPLTHSPYSDKESTPDQVYLLVSDLGQDQTVYSDTDKKYYSRSAYLVQTATDPMPTYEYRWHDWREGAESTQITQMKNAINLRAQQGDLISQINLAAGQTLIQSDKIYLDAGTVAFSGKAFIPSAAIASLEADKITTGTLNGVHIHQIANANGRSIDIANGNISLNSSDPYEPRITFNYQGKETKMFNAVGDLEADSFSIFNFAPSDTSSLHPITYFSIANTGGSGSGNASMHLDHAIINGHEWWASADGITFGRSYDGQNSSSTYVDLYAKSFDPHSQLSSKTRIERLDGREALATIMNDDMYTYQYKSDVASGSTKRYASLIIDDVNDVKQYRSPKIFIADNGKCRDDGTQLAYLIAAFQYQHQVINELTDKVNQLEEKING